MKGVTRYGAVCLLAYILFMVALLPANRVYPLLKENTAFPISLYEVSGTLWSGSAAVAQVNRQYLESLNWSFSPLALLLARVEMELEFSKGDGQVEITAGRSLISGSYIKESTVNFPVAELESMLSRTPLGLTGEFSMQLENIKVADNHVTAAEGKLQLQDVAIGSFQDLVIGSFVLDIETTAEGVKGIFKDAGGLIQADGVLLLKEDGSYKLTASFVSRDPKRNEIRQALQFLGRADPKGKVTMTHSGKLEVNKYLPFV